jgi:hypothetical protein
MVGAVTSVPISARAEENLTALGGKRSSELGGSPMAIRAIEVLSTAHRRAVLRTA